MTDDTRVVTLADAPGTDARHRSVEQMLEHALADVRRPYPDAPGARPVKAVLIVQWRDGDVGYIDPHNAGVTLPEALGLLELGKAELLSPPEER